MAPHGYEKVSTDADEGNVKSQQANLFSLLTFQWFNNVPKIGNQRPLEECDFLPLSEEDSTGLLIEQLQNKWQDEVKQCKQGKRPKLWKSVMKMFSFREILLIVSAVLLETVCLLFQPLLIGYLISLLMSIDEPQGNLLLYGCATALTVISLIKSLSMQQFDYRSEVLGIRLSAAIKGIIYHKIPSLSKHTLEEFTTGRISDLMSNDVQRMELAPYWIFNVLQIVIHLVSVTFLLTFLIGWQAVMGVVFLVSLVPYYAVVSSANAALRLRTVEVSDQRISLMHEIVSGIRAIKSYAWEPEFRERIKSTRSHEISIIRLRNILLSSTLSFITSVVAVATFLSITTLVVTGQRITPVTAFMLLSFINGIRRDSLPSGLLALFETYVSLKRVEDYLLLDTLPSLSSEDSQPNARGNVNDEMHKYSKGDNIGQNSVFSEPMPTMAISVSSLSCKANGKYLLQDISFQFPVNGLTVITGPVGSGKTTLLSSIVGEVSHTSGTIQSCGTILFVPQTAWVFSGTIQENILFGRPYDDKRYRKVIEACALMEDIERFPEYDQTVVGERGVVLSGGQKARVSLARAVYADANTILMDDPLSAVDLKVSEHIFNRCFMELLCDKTRVLVSHQENHMRAADQLIVLEKGRVQGKGSFTELKEKGITGTITDPFQMEIREKKKPQEQRPEEGQFHDLSPTTFLNNGQSKGLEIPREHRVIGTVSWKLYWDYFRSGTHPLAIMAVVTLFLITQAIRISTDVWLSYLTQLKEQHDKTTLTVYGGLVIASVIFAVIRSYIFLLASLRCSERLHDKMVVAVLQAPVLFFDLNPTGRVINRFSKDIGCLDEVLPKDFLIALTNSLFAISAILLPGVANPWVLLVIVPFIAASVYIARYYLKSSRELKRLESICRSPVFSHLSETLDGLDTIRTRGRQKDFIDQFCRHQDTHNQSFIMVVACRRWLGVRLDVLCGLLSGAVALAAVLLSQNAALTGLVLTYVTDTVEMTQLSVRFCSEVENLMTSVERVMTYTRLDSEPGYKEERLPPKHWPLEGSMTFKDASLTYYQGGPQVLRNMNFSIAGKAKIGVVGRTGAGKSSLLAAVLRMPDADGDIIIDGVKLKEINLQESRRCISVLIQSPFLFSGSVRRNLDPIGKHQDAVLWRALEDVQLKHLVKNFDGQLDYELLEKGSNLSVGERQLMCLARVLMEGNKIIILDEPTAHVDPDTEKIIWNTVREKLKDSTVITIAHRLNTVRDCDMILVFREGEVVEFDTFDALLGRERGVLADMAAASTSDN